MDNDKLNQLMQLIEGVKQKQTALDQVAKQGTQGMPLKRPGQTGGDMIMGRGDMDQKRALMGMASNILNRDKTQQTGIGAAAQGFEKGSQIMDEIRLKQKAEKMTGARTELQGAQENYNKRFELEKERYRRERDTKEDEQWLKDYEQAAEGRTYASQVKFHEQLITDYRNSVQDAAEAEQLSSDMSRAVESFGEGGLGVRVDEWIKTQTGARDQISKLRTRFTGLKNRKMVEGLPPGVASDRDVALINAGFPDENTATLGEMKEWADMVAKVERNLAEYNRFAQKYVGDNNYDARGLVESWEKYLSIKGSRESKEGPQEFTSPGGVKFTVK